MRRVSVLLLVGLAACGGGEGGGEVVTSSADPRLNVMVIDDGFDPGDPVLAGRVAGQYSVLCSPGADPLDFQPYQGVPLADRKAALLALLRTRDERCHLQTGIEDKPDPLADVSTYRPAWNRAIENDTDPDAIFTPAQHRAILRGRELARGSYHGTATAGLVAHANPEVRLVLVEMDLSFRVFCPDQRELDELVALFSDPEVARAYAERPSVLADGLRSIITTHRIGLVNESFGNPGQAEWEGLLADARCPQVTLRPYLSMRGRLLEAWDRAHPRPGVLLVKAAGNDGAPIATAEDHEMCEPRLAPRLLVGAYDLDGTRASFSNYGTCVDVYAPGEDVVAHLPEGWLMPLPGTSFAAPLVVRLISLDRAAGAFAPEAARAGLWGLRDAQRRLSVDRFPHELMFDPERKVQRWVAEQPGGPTWPAPRTTAAPLLAREARR